MSEMKPIPVVPLRGGVVFPGTTTTIFIGRRRSLLAARYAMQQDGDLLIVIQYETSVEKPKTEDLVPVGILATVKDVLRAPQAGVQMLVELRERVQFDGLTDTDPHLFGTYSPLLGVTYSAIAAARLHGMRLEGRWITVGTPSAIEPAERAVRAAGAT